MGFITLFYRSVFDCSLIRIASVLMFFMEVTIMGVCVERLAFINGLLKYLRNWHRAVLYMG